LPAPRRLATIYRSGFSERKIRLPVNRGSTPAKSELIFLV
jgi:hypothetical protein